MAGGSIKGITIQFAGDTTKLDKALRQIKNSTKDIDKELRDVNKALKFNPTSVELWRQKQDLLKQKIKETETNLEKLKNIQSQMDANGVDKNSEAYRRVSREIIEAESKLKTFNTELRKTGQVNLRAMSEQFKVMGDKLTSAGQAMKGLSMAAAAVAASIGAVTVKSGKWADDINTMSKVYSIGTKELQQYSAAAELVDVDVETIAKSHSKLTKQMNSAAKGTGASAEAFEKLGVDVTNADGSLRDGDAVWQDTIAALGQMENETERDALAMQLMGKSAQELNPLIEDGGEAYKNLADTLAKYDLDFIDQDTLDQANEFNDSLDTIKAVGMVAFQQLGTQLAAYLAPAMEKVVDLVGQIAGWFANLSPETQALIAGVAGFVAVLAPLLIGLGKVSFAISSVMSLMATIGPAIGGVLATLGPIVLVIGGLVAAGILLYKNWDKIKAFAKKLKKDLVKTFEEIKKTVTKAWESVKTATIKVWNTIKTAVTNAINAVRLNITVVLNAIRTTFTTIWNSIQFATVTAWNAIKTAIITPITTAKNTLVTIVNTIKTTLTTAFSTISTTVRTAFEAVKNAITEPINKAKDLVSSAVNTIKSIFPIQLGKIFSGVKLPHFKISGGKVPWGIGGEGVAPSVKIEWYKTGGIFNSPTIAGIGEAGPEAVVPLDTLWRKLDNIADASSGGGIVINVYASPGMNVNELASAIEQKLVAQQKQRRAAWGY